MSLLLLRPLAAQRQAYHSNAMVSQCAVSLTQTSVIVCHHAYRVLHMQHHVSTSWSMLHFAMRLRRQSAECLSTYFGVELTTADQLRRQSHEQKACGTIKHPSFNNPDVCPSQAVCQSQDCNQFRKTAVAPPIAWISKCNTRLQRQC